MDNNNKNTDKKSLAYFAGQGIALIISAGLSAIFIALCVKGITWIFAL